MPFAAALSTLSVGPSAVQEACDHALNQLGATPQVAFLFLTPHHADVAGDLAAMAMRRLTPAALLGCIGEAIVGNDREIENGPAVCVWLGRWDEPVELEPFHLTLEQTPDGISLLGWPDGLEDAQRASDIFLVLADPFSFPVDDFLQQLAEECPLRVFGGMASGGRGPGESRLLYGGRAVADGAVGLLLRGPVGVRGVVSQGCRPIGQPLVVTKARDNVILELGGRSPLARLQELWQSLGAEDRRLLQQGLHLGRVMNEYQGRFDRGDFLVRNVLGLDRTSGALAVADRLRVGQTVQFHVRDAVSADEDLHALLQRDLATHERRPSGALLFTCNGRGTRLFEEPHHDARAIRTEAGAIPLAGFFAQGEIGPIGDQNFIHGFTASVVLFE